MFGTFGAFPGMSDVLSDRVRDATKAIARFSEMSEREESFRAFMRDLADTLTGKDLREIAELARYFIEGARADGLTIR